MPLVAILLVPVILLIIKFLNKFGIKKSTRIFLHIDMLVIAFIYSLCALTLNIEPFIFEINSASDYLIYFSVVFMFSPCLWVILYYYCNKVFRRIRVYKNKKIKSKKEYIYYRDDLNKISPTILMFTSTMDTDMRKAIATTLLKLKLTGYIKETDNELKCTNKKDTDLLESEKMVLKSIKTHKIDDKLYKSTIKEEALKYKYLKKNNSGKILKIIKMIITAIVPVFIIFLSIKFDTYVFENYKTYIYDGKRYVCVSRDGDIGDIYYGEIENIDDYYHGYIGYGKQREAFYDKALIRVNKFDNEHVLKTVVMQDLDAVFMVASILSAFVAIYSIIEQMLYFNKGYVRTAKGTEILTKAYALKNYLKDYSLIKDRKKEELILWEYYLIYAVVLDVNENIENDIIEKYIDNIL